MTDTVRYVTIRQACQEAGVSRTTMYKWLKSGTVTHRRTAGGSVRILAETLPTLARDARGRVLVPTRRVRTSPETREGPPLSTSR